MNDFAVTISADAIIKAGALLGACATFGGVLVWLIKFVERQKRQDQEIAAIREENCMICYGILACLKGLKEQGCNGPVTEALDKLERHINKAAHKIPEV